MWDLETGHALRTLEGHSRGVEGVALSADGRRAVSASFDSTLKVWDLEKGQALRTLEGHSSGVKGVALSADGRRALSGSWDHALKVWDVDGGRSVGTFTCDDGVLCCAFIGDDRLIAGRRWRSPSHPLHRRSEAQTLTPQGPNADPDRCLGE